MSTQSNPTTAPQNSQNTYFHTQRALLVSEIATALDTTLTHLNRLNRSLESITSVGGEFSSVEALWSQFENVMGNVAKEKPQNEMNDARSEGRSDGEEDERGGEEDGETSVDMGDEPVRRER